ncbi:MAG: 16S rRNA (cytosine(1402)-N(4))-methyltransferase RsmH [Anaerolineales bacterium]|nr:16S rRNA (cytosine(1402)-N(4))-methyltransferase RsmH [Anaerolineales bacterium]
MTEHLSVLYKEALAALNIVPHGRYIDGTLGAGGHTRGILSQGGLVLAFDWDPEAIQYAQKALAEFGEQVTFANASFAEMADVAPQHGFTAVDGVLLDLGLSSRQLDNPERGFAFRFDAPLDMRFDTRRTQTAADLVNTLPESALADIFWRYGDEKQSRRIARAIVAQRPLQTTTQLADLVAREVRGRQKIHPATRVFQALRIAVNGELDALEKGLDAAISLLKPGGRLAVISFHSLEDRLVKNVMRDLSQEEIWPDNAPEPDPTWRPVLTRVTRKPIVPTAVEIAANPRSRSAKLRVAEKR